MISSISHLSPGWLDQHPSIPAAFFAMADADPNGVVYQQAIIEPGLDSPERVRPRRTVTYAEMRERVTRIASYLRHIGAKPGNKIAIIANSRAEWLEADLAILSIGGVTVSVYQSIPALDAGYILYDSESSFVFVENQEQFDKIKELMGRPIPIPATEDRAASNAQLGFKKIISFESCEPHPLLISLADILAARPAASTFELSNISRAQLASLVYTSGTTGPPKGVMQTHGNHLANVRQAFQSGLYEPGWSFVLVLPLAHSFARLIGYIASISPARVIFPAITDTKHSKASAPSVTKDIREANAEIIPLVPRLLEKMESAIKTRARSAGITASLLRLALQAAATFQETGKKNLLYHITNPMRCKIKRRLFGSKFQFVLIGGAKLGVDTGKFFESLGIPCLEGYGLTETCVATNVNRMRDRRLGSVGPVLAPDIEIRISGEGEICYRGPNITSGYYNRPIATKASWDNEGFFHTGDLGSISPDGFLTIQGRKKELIVGSNGKKIAPDRIEQLIKSAEPMISQFVMYGEARSYCVGLVTLNHEAVHAWAEKNKITLGSDPTSDPRLKETIIAHVEQVNESLANYETIKRIEIIADDFTVDNGMLTPTFKVRRQLVYKKYESVINNLYSDE